MLLKLTTPYNKLKLKYSIKSICFLVRDFIPKAFCQDCLNC